MSTPASVAVQPESFAFTPENQAAAQKVLGHYPPDRKQSAVLPLLHLAQKQHDNWLPRAAMDHVADFLGVPRIKVYEVATFYSMYNKKPMGKHHLQVCTALPCWLRGSEEIVGACKRRLGVELGETTPDGLFTVTETECLGACANAPVVMNGQDYYEDLDEPAVIALIDKLARGEAPTPGSQIGRQGSCPVTGPTTLKDGPRHVLPASAEAAEPVRAGSEPLHQE